MTRYLAVADRARETVGRSLANTNWGKRIDRLGYALFSSSVDSFGRTWKYRTFPKGSGTINQFDSLRELVLWVRQVEQIRWMTDVSDEYFNALPAISYRTVLR